jgi:hypothetical protein
MSGVKITIEIPNDLFLSMSGIEIAEKVSSTVQGVVKGVHKNEVEDKSTLPVNQVSNSEPEVSTSDDFGADADFMELSPSEQSETIVSYLPPDLIKIAKEKWTDDPDEQKAIFTTIVSKIPYRRLILALPKNKLNNICYYFDMSIEEIKNPNPMANNPMGGLMSMFGGLTGAAGTGGGFPGMPKPPGKSTRKNIDME